MFTVFNFHKLLMKMIFCEFSLHSVPSLNTHTDTQFSTVTERHSCLDPIQEQQAGCSSERLHVITELMREQH